MQNIDVMLEPLRALLQQVGAFMPRLALAVCVLVVGWLLAKAFRFSVVKALRALNFHVLTERAGIDGFLQQGGTEKDTTELFGWLAYALVILASLIVAFNSLGLTQVTDLLGRILLFVPRLLVALLVVVFGSYFARFAYSPARCLRRFFKLHVDRWRYFDQRHGLVVSKWREWREDQGCCSPQTICRCSRRRVSVAGRANNQRWRRCSACDPPARRTRAEQGRGSASRAHDRPFHARKNCLGRGRSELGTHSCCCRAIWDQGRSVADPDIYWQSESLQQWSRGVVR